MPIQDLEIYKRLDSLHTSICSMLDSPGADERKVSQISDVLSEMRSVEPDVWWKDHLLKIDDLIKHVLELSVRSENAGEYDAASSHLKEELRGYYNHICSIRPREY